MRGAVVGVGYLGTFHAQKIAANPKSELVAVFDHFAEQSKKVADTLKTQSVQNLDEIAKLVDFVTIAASTQAHYELAQFFLNKNIPVLVEKPIAATAELGLQIRGEGCRSAGCSCRSSPKKIKSFSLWGILSALIQPMII